MKKKLFFISVMLCLAVAFFVNAQSFLKNEKPQSSPGNVDSSFFESFSKLNAAEIENKIREAERVRFEERGGSTKKQIEQTLDGLGNGKITLRQVFADTFFAGDSLMNGLEVYGILKADNLATQVSASLYHLSESIPKIVSANPQNLIIHYGVNMISADKFQLDNFIADYEPLVKKLQKNLPETRIIISGLFPVDLSLATEAKFKRIDEYNKALAEMSEKLGVEFLDSKKAFEGNSDYYGGDGIHLSSGFYSKVWLPFIVENKGIIG